MNLSLPAVVIMLVMVLYNMADTFFIGQTGSILAVLIYLARDTIIATFIDNEEVIAYGQIFVIASVIIGPFFQRYLEQKNRYAYSHAETGNDFLQNEVTPT